MIRILILTAVFLSNLSIKAQDTAISYTLEQAEEQLLSRNLGLLAQRLNIDIAEAELIQARIWPNPTLEVDEVNLYATSYQQRTGEALPSLFGSDDFGRYRQISAQIEQLIETAGKRKKRIAIHEVSRQMADAYLEDFLLSLRTEFRETIYNFHYTKLVIELLQNQTNSLQTLIQAYSRQFEEGNISKADLIRLRATYYRLRDDIIEMQEGLNEQQRELIVMLNLPDDSVLSFREIFDKDYDYNLQKLQLEHNTLQEQALKQLPRAKLADYEVTKNKREYDYERALRIPDFTVSVGYDRGGNILQDFVGVGFSVDLPFFDRNQGGIRRAAAEVSQAELEQLETILQIKAGIREKYDNLEQISRFFDEITPDYISDLEASMDAYNQFFIEQTVNLLAYLDFTEAYIDNMQTILENQKDFLTALEELNYATGRNFQH